MDWKKLVNFVIDGSPCQGLLIREDASFYLDEIADIPVISYEPSRIVCYHEHQVFVLYKNQVSSRKIFPAFVVENFERPFLKQLNFA